MTPGLNYRNAVFTQPTVPIMHEAISNNRSLISAPLLFFSDPAMRCSPEVFSYMFPDSMGL